MSELTKSDRFYGFLFIIGLIMCLVYFYGKTDIWIGMIGSFMMLPLVLGVLIPKSISFFISIFIKDD